LSVNKNNNETNKAFYRLTLTVDIGHTFHWFLALRVSGHIKAGYIKVFVPVIVH